MKFCSFYRSKYLQLMFYVAVPITMPSFDALAQTPEANHSTADAFQRYCVTCHNDTLKTAGLVLEGLDPADIAEHAPVWEKVLRKLRNREMPPAGMPRPDENTYQNMITFLMTELDRSVETNLNPGRAASHRLNRTEYANVIRDLLALEIDSVELLPADDMGYGFDNIADVLSVSPFLLERYLTAAARISRLAVGDTSLPPLYRIYDVPRTLIQDDRLGEDLPYGSRGGVAIRHHFPVDGEYLIKVKLQTGRYDDILGMEKDRQLDIRIDQNGIKRFTIAADTAGYGTAHSAETAADRHLEVRVPVKAGTRTVVATFVKDTTKPEGILSPEASREQAFFEGVGSIAIGGPYNIEGPGDTASRARIFICRPTADLPEDVCANRIISNLARRAYRRPITDEDLVTVNELYQQGKASGGFETGIRMALQKILVSPEFLFRLEFDPTDIDPGQAYQISDIDLASRLSFFLWSSIPDDELLDLAEQEKLKDRDILQQQVRRMLADTRSQALITNFAGQWLFLRNISRVIPDPIAFPNFDENLRMAMQKETELLIESMFREDRSVVELLNSDYTFLNERLAQHYGIDGIYGTEFQRVQITDPRRMGLLGHSSILTVTSYPNRTAPTIRGKWVLEQLLGSPPPPPPPDVPSLAEDKSKQILTMRERMENHRANPACAVCHKVMDPLGFALENFDGLGRWRETIGTGNSLIDASGELPDGTTFDGPEGLRELLLTKQDLFVETFTERLLTYALGRGVEYYDYPVIRKIQQDAADNNYRWSAVISGIVNSVPFQMRRASSQ